METIKEKYERLIKESEDIIKTLKEKREQINNYIKEEQMKIEQHEDSIKNQLRIY